MSPSYDCNVDQYSKITNLSISHPIEYNFQARDIIPSGTVNIETFLKAKRNPSQNSVISLRMYEQDGCATPRNQSFLINFNGIFDEVHRNIAEEKVKSKQSLI
jgi:hypothetical protein